MKSIELTSKQLEAIRLLIYPDENGNYRSQNRVAREIGISKYTMIRWFKKEAFRNKFKEIINEKYQAIAAEAQNAIINLMHNAKSERTRLDAAKDILDRAGYKPVEQIQDLSTVPIRIEIADEQHNQN